MKSAEEYYEDIQPLLANGWHEAAICALEQLRQTHPTFAPACGDLGTLYYKAGHKDKALECYKRAAEYDPENIGFLKCLADFYHAELEQVEEALAVYKQIIGKGAKDADTLFIAANLSVVLHNFEDAADYYQQVLEIEPWHAEAFEYLDKIRSQHPAEGETSAPEELYRQSKEMGAGGDLEGAVSKLAEVIQLYPEFAPAHNDLGVYHQKTGNDEEALKHLQRAVRLEPYNNTFAKNLADFYFLVKGQVTDALEIYLDVLKRNPEDVEVLMAAGHICEAVNRFEDAKLFYSRVIDIEPWRLEASESLEGLQERLKRQDGAGL
ncbi:MAG: tetratricopeptide repeat protein [Desulfobacterales bacterium]|nr:MAG: tetratricopeptide repeat protein [Desulfobacterales bacterium]